MVIVKGDTHGDINELAIGVFPAQKHMSKKDYLIIAGDFGFIWDENYRRNINMLDRKNFTTLFIDGNHESMTLINSFPVSMWNGGKVHKISDSVIHLMRGQVFNIEGFNIFTFGGGQSIDKDWRIEGISWWKEEMPDKEEYKEGLYNLKKVNNKVDYIITHECSNNIFSELFKYKLMYKIDNELRDYFDKIEECKFKKWYFGHYHVDQLIDDKHFALYHRFTQLR